jgi:ribosomal protein S18 acetylase RimI-like enzyme
MSIQLIESRDVSRLVPLLRDAEEGDDRVRRTIEDPAMTAYIAQDGEKTIGAVVMHWTPDESEIIYIATDVSLRGRGYGKAVMRALMDEARQRDTKAVCVGTSNTSWDNIAFYQKCGFRMHEVRKDFFSYLPTPLYEDGIKMQDMLVLRYDLTGTE